jgi:hypothetical protein
MSRVGGNWMLGGRPRNAGEAKARGLEGRRLSPEEIAKEAAKLGLPVYMPKPSDSGDAGAPGDVPWNKRHSRTTSPGTKGTESLRRPSDPLPAGLRRAMLAAEKPKAGAPLRPRSSPAPQLPSSGQLLETVARYRRQRKLSSADPDLGRK